MDHPTSTKLPAVSIEGRDSDQRGDFLTIKFSQFRQFCNERRGGDFSDSHSALEDFGFFFPLVIRFYEACDFLIDRRDFLRKMFDVLLQTPANDLRCGRADSVFLAGSQRDELSSAGHELVEFVLLFVGFFRSFAVVPALRISR